MPGLIILGLLVAIFGRKAVGNFATIVAWFIIIAVAGIAWEVSPGSHTVIICGVAVIVGVPLTICASAFGSWRTVVLSIALIVGSGIGYSSWDTHQQSMLVQSSLNSGEHAYEQRNYTEAIRCYQDILSKYDLPEGSASMPGTRSNLKWRLGVNFNAIGEVAYSQGRYSDAKDAFAQALSADPSNELAKQNSKIADASLRVR